MQRIFVIVLLLLMVEHFLLSNPAAREACAGCQDTLENSPRVNIDMPGSYQSGLWEYRLIVTSPGSKSEGTRGKLFYAGKPVDEPLEGDYYRTPWGEIQWLENDRLWGEHGWMLRRPGSKFGRALPEPWHLADGPIVMAMVLRAAEELPKDQSLAPWVSTEIEKLGGKGFVIERPWFPVSEQATTIYDTKLEGRLTVRLCPTREAATLTVAFEGSEPAKLNLSRTDGATALVLRKPTSPLSDGTNYYLAFRVERSAPQWPKVLDIGPDANGQTITVKGGTKEIVIGLPGDLQTGATWMVKRMRGVSTPNLSVAPSAQPQFVSKAGAEVNTERRGVFENVFRVTGTGKTSIELEHRREWQTEVPEEQTFTVILDIQAEPAPAHFQVDSIEWDTRGGGDFHFDVRRSEEGSFTVRVTRRQFREDDTTVMLNREKSRQVYDLLARIFDGKEELSGSETSEGSEPTGTWTSVYVVDQNKKRHKIGNSSLQNELEALRDWVEAQLPPVKSKEKGTGVKSQFDPRPLFSYRDGEASQRDRRSPSR